MKLLLHILTKENDALALEVIQRQREQGGAELVVVDLTKPQPDYPTLLGKIFAADSVLVW